MDFSIFSVLFSEKTTASNDWICFAHKHEAEAELFRRCKSDVNQCDIRAIQQRYLKMSKNVSFIDYDVPLGCSYSNTQKEFLRNLFSIKYSKIRRNGCPDDNFCTKIFYGRREPLGYVGIPKCGSMTIRYIMGSKHPYDGTILSEKSLKSRTTFTFLRYFFQWTFWN